MSVILASTVEPHLKDPLNWKHSTDILPLYKAQVLWSLQDCDNKNLPHKEDNLCVNNSKVITSNRTVTKFYAYTHSFREKCKLMAIVIRSMFVNCDKNLCGIIECSFVLGIKL